MATKHCQHCNVRLNITGADSFHPEAFPSYRHMTNQSLMGASVFGSAKIDDSFVLLDPRVQRVQAGGDTQHGQGGRLDESFLLVAGSASMLRQGGAHGGMQASSQGIPVHAMDEKLLQIARTFEIVSGDTQVDQPLCMECSAAVQAEVEAAVAEAEEECAAYQAALDELSRQEQQPLPHDRFAEDMRAAEAELQAEEQRAKQAEAELEEAQAELAALREQAGQLEDLEQRYWHSANQLTSSLRWHADQRTSLQRKIWRSEAQLKLLQATNVYNDVFNIWFEGPFGTISGLRLGRMPNTPVEWDEINAAWGQCVLMLHTMAQACKLTFSAYQLLPMGSFPRIQDKKGTMDLFGPVHKLICPSYDRAMVSFLSCLKEFYTFAQARDQAEGRTPLDIVYEIEGDLVGNMSIKLMFNKDANWTKALKYMLANLKWALAWMVAQQSGRVLVKPENWGTSGNY